jgi:transglutaminase-like putative cysteine protease
LSTSTQLFDSQAVQPGGAALWSSARKIGVTATGLAVLVPIVVPTLSTNLFAGNGPGSGGDGAGVSMSNPMVGLKRDLTRGADIDLVRVVTPERNPGYLRISVLDHFDGESWRPSGRDIPVSQRAEGIVPRPPGLDASVPRVRVPYEIEISDDLKSTWLPTPYPVFSISAPGDWRYDRSTLDFVSAADGQTTAGMSYDLEALDVEPTAEQLADAGPAPSSVSAPNTALPRNLPIRIRLLARTVTADAPTKLQKAARLQEWFRVDGGFTYSLDRAPGTGMETLLRFLDTGPGGRVGYCEQFAAAMALMGRAIGIPSRVAVGFLRPSPAGPDTYVYSSHDLHAWPEMYFEGVGWVRFEPTPQARTGHALPAYTSGQVPGAQPSSSASGPSARPTLPDRLERTPSSALAGGDSSGGGSGRGDFVSGLLFVLLVGLLLSTPRLLRSALRERRWMRAGGRGAMSAPEAAWAELRDSTHDLGLGWDDRVTVRRQARTLARAFGRAGGHADALSRSETRGAAADPAATEALDRLVEQVERDRYARPPADGDVSAPTRGALRADVERCVDALEAGASKRQRTRATWFPASLTRRWRGRPAPTYAVGQAGVDHAV